MPHTVLIEVNLTWEVCDYFEFSSITISGFIKLPLHYYGEYDHK